MEGEVGSGARLRKLGALTGNILFLFQRAPNYLVFFMSNLLLPLKGLGFLVCVFGFHQFHHLLIPHSIEGKLIRTRSVSNLEEGPTGKKSHGSHFN